MPRFRFVGLVVSMLSGIALPDIPSLSLIGFGYVKIPPLSTNRDNPIHFTVFLGKGDDYSLNISFKYKISEHLSTFYEESGNAKILERTIYFPKENVKSGGIYLKITVNSKVLKNGSDERFFNLSKVTPHNIALANNYATHFETTANYAYSVYNDDGLYKNYPEVFDFINFQKEQEQSYYNYLDLDKIIFKYECTPDDSFTYQDCYIYLQNYNHWFDNIGEVFGNFRKISLSINKRNDGFHFELKDPIYVDKSTNKLFASYQEKCFLTKKLFLPKNGFTKDTIQMNLNIKGAGFNEASISQTFLFSFNSNYLGNCYDSEYCISSTQAETNFDYGEIEER